MKTKWVPVSTAVCLLALEVAVTVATAHQHHSEGKWEISAAYFNTIVGYVLHRLIYWTPRRFCSS